MRLNKPPKIHNRLFLTKIAIIHGPTKKDVNKVQRPSLILINNQIKLKTESLELSSKVKTNLYVIKLI